VNPPLTPFEYAFAHLKMWDAYDRSEPDVGGCKLQRGKASTIAFIEALAVVSAIWRIAAMKGLPPTVVERRTTYVFEEGL